MIEQNKAAYQAYSATFPSDEFLEKHFCKDFPIEGIPHQTKSTRLFVELRRLFDQTLSFFPRHILKNQLLNETGVETVHIFRDGKPGEWINPRLDECGLMGELSSETFSELCQEFISHCEAGALYQSDWWKWKTEGQSIWIEAIPEALVDGKPKRRTLKDVISPEKQD